MFDRPISRAGGDPAAWIRGRLGARVKGRFATRVAGCRKIVTSRALLGIMSFWPVPQETNSLSRETRRHLRYLENFMVVPPIDPFDVGKGLSVLASILSITSSVLKIREATKQSLAQALASFKTQASAEQDEIMRSSDYTSAILEMAGNGVISSRLLDNLGRKLDECQDRHIKDLDDAKDEQDRMRADDEARSCVCNALRRIIRFDNGVLPTGLKPLWVSYECKP